MKTIEEKRVGFKKFTFVIILTISTLYTHAITASKFKDLITKEFGSLTGIYIMGGIIIGGLGVFFISNHFSKKSAEIEREKEKEQMANRPLQNRRAQRRRPVRR